MPRPKGTTDRQKLYFRALIRHPGRLPSRERPSPIIMRRWLRQPLFCETLASLALILRPRAESLTARDLYAECRQPPVAPPRRP